MLRTIIQFKKVIILAVALSIFLYILTMKTPDGLSVAGKKSLAISVLVIIFWAFEIIPISITGLLAIVLFPALGIFKKKVAFSFFGNSAVFFILGAFILSSSLVRTGLARRIGLYILHRFGRSQHSLLIVMLLLPATMSLFITEHAVAAIMLPVVLEITSAIGLIAGDSGYAKRLFLATGWGCVIGGIGTLLGGARGPLASGIMEGITGTGIGFLQWSKVGIPIALFMLISALFILYVFYPAENIDIEKAARQIKKELKSMGRFTFEEIKTGILMLITLFCWIFLGDRIGLAIIALSSVVIAFILGILDWREVEEDVNWGIFLMYGGAITLGHGLTATNAASWLVNQTMISNLHDPFHFTIITVTLTLFLTEIMSNSAVVTILTPIAISIGSQVGLSALDATLIVAVPSGLAFSMPISTPAIALIHSTGFVRIRDTLKGGIVLSLLAIVYMYVVKLILL